MNKLAAAFAIGSFMSLPVGASGQISPDAAAVEWEGKKVCEVLFEDTQIRVLRVRGLRGIWVSCGEAEGPHFVSVLSFGEEFRVDGAVGDIQEKFGEALA